MVYILYQKQMSKHKITKSFANRFHVGRYCIVPINAMPLIKKSYLCTLKVKWATGKEPGESRDKESNKENE
jgi:hypothetical protein